MKKEKLWVDRRDWKLFINPFKIKTKLIEEDVQVVEYRNQSWT
jgi:hypothetical protein